jgi:hypothetical protein
VNIPQLAISEITDEYIRKNFESIRDFLPSGTPFRDFKLFELTFTKTENNFKFKHNLGFLPKDIFLTRQEGSGSVVFNYPLATAESIDMTISGTVTPDNPYKIRFFAGTYSS